MGRFAPLTLSYLYSSFSFTIEDNWFCNSFNSSFKEFSRSRASSSWPLVFPNWTKALSFLDKELSNEDLSNLASVWICSNAWAVAAFSFSNVEISSVCLELKNKIFVPTLEVVDVYKKRNWQAKQEKLANIHSWSNITRRVKRILMQERGDD